MSEGNNLERKGEKEKHSTLPSEGRNLVEKMESKIKKILENENGIIDYNVNENERKYKEFKAEFLKDKSIMSCDVMKA